LALPPQVTGGGAPIVIQKGEQLDATASLTVPLLAPSAYPSLSAARRSEDAQRATLATSQATILYQTAQTFFAAASSDELYAARRHAIEVARETMTTAQARFDAGSVNRTEITRARLALERAEQAALDAADTQAQTYRALATLIDLHEPFAVQPTG